MKELLTHWIFLTVFSTWIICQFIKTLLKLPVFLKNKKQRAQLLETLLWKTGGMPSSHSATIMCLFMCFALTEGSTAPITIMSLAFVFIVTRDALGVRRSSGNQARTLNILIQEFNRIHQTSIKKVKEIQGHNATEVLVGLVIGVLVALFSYRFFWK